MRNFIACLSAGSLLALAGATQAAPPNPATANLAVSATVVKNCTVVAPALGFGNYYPGAGALSVNSNLAVSCTKTTPFTVSLNKGLNGTIAQRLLSDGAGNTLQYNLYTTAAFGTVFGDGTGGSATQGGTGTGMATPVTVTAYGNLPDNATNQAIAPTAVVFTDTVVVSVAY
jgi:spore coat protein U-like protein